LKPLTLVRSPLVNIGVVLLLALPLVVLADDKIPVADLTDLPIHTYPIEGTVTELLSSESAFASFSDALREDLETTLAKYDIRDASTLKRMYGTLMTLELLDGNDAAALAWIEPIQSLEDKEANRLMVGVTTQAVVAARKAGAPGSPEYVEAFERELDSLISQMPWDVVQDRIQAGKGRAEILSRNVLLGMVQSEMDPVVALDGLVHGLSKILALVTPRTRVHYQAWGVVSNEPVSQEHLYGFLREFHRDREREFEQLIRHGQVTGAFRADVPADVIVQSMGALLSGFIYRAAFDPDTANPEALQACLQTVIRDVLLCDDSARPREVEDG